MANFLYQTRNGYYHDGYQAESEPDADDDSESLLWITDSESEFGGEIYPRTVHACDRMEVEGQDVGGDDIAAGMFPRSCTQRGMSGTFLTATATMNLPMQMEVLRLALSSHLAPWLCLTNSPRWTPPTRVSFRFLG